MLKSRTRGLEWGVMAALVLIGAVVRISMAQLPHVLQGDEGAYLWLGKTLVSGEGYQFFGKPELHYAPLFPLVSGLVWLVARDLEAVSAICFVTFGALTGVPLFLLGRRLYGHWAGWGLAALTAVSPALTAQVYFWSGMAEPLYLFLLFWGIFFAVRALDDDRLVDYLAAGAMYGLAYLTKPEAWIYLALTAGYLLVVRGARPIGRRWRSLLKPILLVLAFAVVIFPYVLFLRQHLGYWSLTGKTWMAFVQQRAYMDRDWITFDRISWGLDSSSQEVMYHSMEKFQGRSLWEEVRADPRDFLGHVARNARNMDSVLLSKRVLPFFLLPLLGMGLFGRGWGSRRLRAEPLLLLLALAPAAALLVFTTELRFYLATLILFYLWVAQGIVEWGNWAGETWAGLATNRPRAELFSRVWRWGLIAGAVALCGAYFLLVQPAAARDGVANQRVHYKVVGEWLGQHAPTDAVVMSRGAIVAIHADRFWVPFPHAEYDEALRYARAHAVDYLVVNENECETMRPQLAFLADPIRDPPAGLSPVLVYPGDQGFTIVYQLQDAGVDADRAVESGE